MLLFNWSWSSSRWREEAARYASKAEAATRPARRQRLIELERLHLEKAQRLELSNFQSKK